ncbi:hypothetical protein VTK56DRAFT_8035 [Thermocarpiscus australiensis]
MQDGWQIYYSSPGYHAGVGGGWFSWRLITAKRRNMLSLHGCVHPSPSAAAFLDNATLRTKPSCASTPSSPMK